MFMTGVLCTVCGAHVYFMFVLIIHACDMSLMFSACCNICFIVGYKKLFRAYVYWCYVQYVPTINKIYLLSYFLYSTIKMNNITEQW